MSESLIFTLLLSMGCAITLIALADIVMDNLNRKRMLGRLKIERRLSPSLPISERSALSKISASFGFRDIGSVLASGKSAIEDIQRLRDMGGRELLFIVAISGALVFGGVSAFVTRSIIATSLGGVAGCIVALMLYRHYRFQTYAKKISKALPVAIDGLIRCLKAGFDLSRSLSIIRDEVSPELQIEFDLMLRNRDLGQSLGDAMYFMADRLKSREALFLASLIAVQERSGGPLMQALEALSQILKDRDRLRLKRMVASAEARMSALILGGLPVVIAALLLSTNPSYRMILLETQSGRLALALCLSLLGIGSFVMYRMVRSPQT